MSDAVLPWHKGGKETRYRELLLRLPEHDLEVTLYTMKWWQGDPPTGPVRYRAICPCLPLYNDERRSIRQAVVFSLCTLRLLAYRFDVIEADQMPVLQLFPLRVVAWIKRVKLLVGWHEVWGRSYWDSYLGKLGPLAALIEASAVRLPDRLLPVTSAAERKLEAIGVSAQKMFVIPNAVDRERLGAVLSSEDAPELLFVGRLLAHKRCDVAIAALALLREQGAAVRLGVIGRGPEMERLVRLAESLGVTDAVRFIGEVNRHEDVWALMKGASVLVFPSEREGFGLSVAESLALGTPVVCSSHADNEARLLVDDPLLGSIVPAGDPRGFVDAIRVLLEAPPNSDTVTAEFWTRHPDLDWDVAAAKYAAQLSLAADLSSSRRSRHR